MKIKSSAILILIIVLALIFRFYFTFSNENFSSDDSYFHLRLVNHILDKKIPLMNDDLSYSGNKIIYPQFFHYLIALFFFIPSYTKIITVLLIISLVVIVYLIAKKITKDKNAALITAFLASFIPIEIKTNLNQVSIYAFIIPLILLMFLALINLDNKKYFNLFLVLSFILPLVHPTSLIFILSLFFYIILANTESINISKAKKEAIFFAFFLILLIDFLIYRNVFLQHGLKIIWQNIPNNLFNEYFKDLNVLEVLYLTGILPIILGSLGIYFGLKRKNNQIALIASAILAVFLLISLKLLNLSTGVLFLSIFLTITSSLTISKFNEYLDLTKFRKFKTLFNIIFILLILTLTLVPSYFVAKSLPNYNKEIEAFTWIKENTPNDSVILAPLELGNILTYTSERKNVADNNFLLAPNPEERITDINIAYQTFSKIEAFDVIKKYKINYILFDDYVKKKYNIERLLYIDDKCFKEVRNDIYKVTC